MRKEVKRRLVRRGRRRTLPFQPDSDQWRILKRMDRGEKLFLLEEHPIAPAVGIGYERGHAERIPSRLFGYLISGEWIRFVELLAEFELTDQGNRAIELWRPSTRRNSKNTVRRKKSPF
jgi:hypothetical protein